MSIVVPEGFDFADPDLLEKRLPLEEFAALRKTSKLFWNEQPRGKTGFDDDGFWVVSRHADVKEISRNHELFSAHANGVIVRFNENVTEDDVAIQKETMLVNQDPPDHTKLRQIVSRGFTPRAINSLRDALQSRAERVVAEAKAKGTGDFVSEVAAELPLQAIAELMGVPQEDRHKLFDWSNKMMAYDDPELAGDGKEVAAELIAYAMGIADERRKCPAQDIVSKLVHADLDGRGLSDDEFGFFVILLSVAGNETTRNAITHGMIAMLEDPEQWELYKAQRPATTADEVVRWATPVTAFQRTATRDTEIGGTPIKAGDRVAMYYSSANWDTEVFDQPEKFNILRDPNPHLGFGGTGAHYCIGANLARVEIDLMFNAIADQMPNISKAGEPRRLRAAWLNAIKEFPVNYV